MVYTAAPIYNRERLFEMIEKAAQKEREKLTSSSDARDKGDEIDNALSRLRYGVQEKTSMKQG